MQDLITFGMYFAIVAIVAMPIMWVIAEMKMSRETNENMEAQARAAAQWAAMDARRRADRLAEEKTRQERHATIMSTIRK